MPMEFLLVAAVLFAAIGVTAGMIRLAHWTDDYSHYPSRREAHLSRLMLPARPPHSVSGPASHKGLSRAA